MVMPLDPHSDDVRQHALLALTAELMRQGHPSEYAKHMAIASIFQTDLELRNAQLSSLLGWLKQEYPAIYPAALNCVEGIRQEFEQRVQSRS